MPSSTSAQSLPWPESGLALEDWLTVPAAPGHFGDRELSGLPDAVARYFTASIGPGATLARSVVLRMEGELRIKDRWRPVTAREVLSPARGLRWAARVGRTITGSDACAGRSGVMSWRLLGLVRIAHAEGADVARSGMGRAAGEAVWLPTALLPRYEVSWAADGVHDIRAVVSAGGVDTTLHLHLDDDGLLKWARFDRWGDPDGTGEWAMHPFGYEVTRNEQSGPFTIPVEGTAGWFHGTDRWADGQLLRVRVTDHRPVGGS